MTRNPQIPLTEAAQALRMDKASLRRTLDRFAITDRDGAGRRVISAPVLALFCDMRERTGYLAPRGISRADLLAAAQKAAASEPAA